MPTEREEYVIPCSTLHHRAPIPLPVVRTPPLRSLDADEWGPRSRRNGRSLVQWRPLRPGTHCLRALRRRAPLPMRVRCALPIRPLPGEAHWPPYCRQVKSIQEQIHTTETTKLFISCEVAQSCPTLRDPMDCSLPGSSVHGIFQARVLEWVAISFSKETSQPRDRTQVSRIAGRRFTI